MDYFNADTYIARINEIGAETKRKIEEEKADKERRELEAKKSREERLALIVNRTESVLRVAKQLVVNELVSEQPDKFSMELWGSLGVSHNPISVVSDRVRGITLSCCQCEFFISEDASGKHIGCSPWFNGTTIDSVESAKDVYIDNFEDFEKKFFERVDLLLEKGA